MLNLLGAIVWAPIFALGGYVFGNAVQHFLGNVKKFEGVIILGIIIVAALLQVILVWRRRQKIK
jgi:membrane protein DedA with SNARE-associated domain